MGILVNEPLAGSEASTEGLFNCITNYLHEIGRDLPVKLTGPRVVRFLAFYGALGFIAALSRAHHLTYSESDRFSACPPPHFSKIHFNIILSPSPRSS